MHLLITQSTYCSSSLGVLAQRSFRSRGSKLFVLLALAASLNFLAAQAEICTTASRYVSVSPTSGSVVQFTTGTNFTLTVFFSANVTLNVPINNATSIKPVQATNATLSDLTSFFISRTSSPIYLLYRSTYAILKPNAVVLVSAGRLQFKFLTNSVNTTNEFHVIMDGTQYVVTNTSTTLSKHVIAEYSRTSTLSSCSNPTLIDAYVAQQNQIACESQRPSSTLTTTPTTSASVQSFDIELGPATVMPLTAASHMLSVSCIGVCRHNTHTHTYTHTHTHTHTHHVVTALSMLL
jgi:hypothetical protein